MKYFVKDYHNEKSEDIIKTGVYTIEFLNKPEIYYVGSATKTNIKFGKSNVGFHGRWREHLYMLFNNKHYNNKLQNNFNKYGKNNLIFKIVDFYEPELCNGAEQYWLNMLDSYRNGYNLSFVVEKTSLGRKLTKEQRKVISDRMLGDKNPNYRKYYTQEERDNIGIIMSKPIQQYDFNGTLIKEWNSIIDVSEKLYFDAGNISKCCNMEQLTYKGYFWFFKNSKININDYIKNTLIRKIEAQRNRNQRCPVKIIIQYDKNYNFVKEWESIKCATEYYKCAKGGISRACSGEYKTYIGYIWKYKII